MKKGREGLPMMGLMLVSYILMSMMLSAVIGKGRFYLQFTSTGRMFRRDHYGEWVEKLFAGISAAGFLPLGFIVLAEVVAVVARDNTEGPFIFSIFIIAVMAMYYYHFILEVAHRCENRYRHLKYQKYTIPCKLRKGKKVASAKVVWRVFERACRTMSQRIVPWYDAELDVLDPKIRAELKRSKRRSGQIVLKDIPGHYGWKEVCQTSQRDIMTKIVAGNLALDAEEPEPQKAEPQKAAPLVNLPTTEELLELQLRTQLEGFSEEDYELVLAYLHEHSELIKLVLSSDYQVPFEIIPATETEPRRVQINGFIFRGCVKTL